MQNFKVSEKVRKCSLENMREKNTSHLEKQNKGVTLVALIVTIVVMLILIAVGVRVIVNSNIIGHAEKTKEAYEQAIIKEKNLGNDVIEINGKTYNSIDEYEYFASLNKKSITFYLRTIDGEVPYTVNDGASWEDFIAEQAPVNSWDIAFFDLQHLTMTESLAQSFGCPLDVIQVAGGGPLFEEPGSWYSGPWVRPNDKIKEGVIYNCER